MLTPAATASPLLPPAGTRPAPPPRAGRRRGPGTRDAMTPWSIHPPSIAPARTPTMGNGSRSGKCVPPRRHKKKPRRWRSGAERISSRNQAAIKPTSAEVFEPDLGDAADHRGQRFHLGDGGDDVFFLRLVGQHDDVGARLVI